MATETCNYCSHLLASVSVRHTRMECQYRRTMWCPVCVACGHSPPSCPNNIAWAVRRGLPITETNIEMRVVDTEDGVKSVLKKHGIVPGSRQMENRKLLRDLANSLNPPHMIVFVN